MKLIACAAALMLGGTALAQTATPAQTELPATTMATPDSDQPDPPVSSDMSTSAEPVAPVDSGVSTSTDPAGGYSSTTTITGTPEPGSPVINAPSATPSEAFPAPAPLKNYPICKKGQFDDCMQRGG